MAGWEALPGTRSTSTMQSCAAALLWNCITQTRVSVLQRLPQGTECSASTIPSARSQPLMDQVYQASFAALHVPTGPPDLCKAKGFTLQDCTRDTGFRARWMCGHHAHMSMHASIPALLAFVMSNTAGPAMLACHSAEVSLTQRAHLLLQCCCTIVAAQCWWCWASFEPCVQPACS